MDESVKELMGDLSAMCRLTANPEAMLSRIDGAIAKDPDHAMLYVLRGWTLTQLDRLDDAEADLRKAVEMNEKLSWAHYRLGQALDKKGMHKEAADAFGKAVKLKPRRGDFWLEKGFAEYDANLFKDAFKSFDKALLLGERSGWAWLGKSKILVLLDMKDDAYEAVQNALNQNQDEPLFHKQKAYVQEQLRG